MSLECFRGRDALMVLRVELSDEQGNRLRRVMKKTRDVVVLRRSMVVMQSAQGYTPPRIAELMDLQVDYVREIVKAFHRDGFESLNPKWGGRTPADVHGRRPAGAREPGDELARRPRPPVPGVVPEPPPAGGDPARHRRGHLDLLAGSP